MRLLDDPLSLRRADPSDMLGRAAALPDQCVEGWERGLSWKVPRRHASLKQVLVLGMGGSAIGADLLQGAVGECMERPVAVNRTYTLPGWVDRRTLVLACSYSGNTEETLSAAELARQAGAPVLAITSGGKLAAWARRHRFPLLQISAGLPPRSAVGYLTFAPLGLFAGFGWVCERELGVERACAGLRRYIASSLASDVPTRLNPAKRLAADLTGRLPVLYGAAGGWEGVTYRWRTQLEENAKTLAFHHLFPEATHNEISAWLNPKGLMRNLAAVFLTDRAIHPRILRRMEFVRRIVRAEGARVRTVSAAGPTLLERMLRMIALGDFTSVYLGILYRVDPTPVERVEALKRFMRGRSILGHSGG